MYNYDNPLITVVTACYNSAATIEVTLKSVLAQTYQNYEYLIIDGKSTDNTLAIVERYRDKFGDKLRVISEKDTGIYNAMNKGVKNSRGEIVGILNSDDFYSETALESVAARYAKERYPYIVINGDMIRVSSSGEEIVRCRFKEKLVEMKTCFGHPSMFAAKAVYDKIGLYDESYRLAADGEWQYRAHDDDDVRYVLTHEVYNHMREGGASDNPKYRWMWFKERVRMKKAHNKAPMLIIYWQEFKSVIRTDLKNILPKGLIKKLYERKYR